MDALALLGPAIGVAGLIASYVYYQKNRKLKRIEWWISLDQSLLADPDDRRFADRVAVTVGTRKLSQPRTVVLRIKNTGGVGLNTATMFSPFAVNFEAGRQLQLMRVDRLRNGVKEPEVLLGGSEVVRPEQPTSLPPALLNPGDTLLCHMLVDGESGGIALSGEAEDFEIKKSSQGEMDDPRHALQVQEQSKRMVYAWWGAVAGLAYGYLIFYV